jgi:hypothetical protein
MEETPYKLGLEERKNIAEPILDKADRLNVFFSINDFKKKPGKKNLLITDQVEEKQVLNLALRQEIHHVVQNSLQSLDDKVQRLNSLTEDYRKYFHSHFNILLNPEAVKIFSIGPKDNRLTHIELIFKFLDIDMMSSRAQPMVQVIEELIMNAQITAPLQRQNVTPKSIEIKIERKKDLIAISAIDYYGTLGVDKFLKRIENAFSVGLGQSINFGRGGAGLGSSIIYKYAESIFLGCITEQCTRVSVVMPFNKSEKIFSTIQKSIHVIKL